MFQQAFRPEAALARAEAIELALNTRCVGPVPPAAASEQAPRDPVRQGTIAVPPVRQRLISHQRSLDRLDAALQRTPR